MPEVNFSLEFEASQNRAHKHFLVKAMEKQMIQRPLHKLPDVLIFY